MRSSFAVLTFTAFILVGCSGNPIKGREEPSVAAKACVPQLFTQDGHIYTTLSVGELVRLPMERQLAIAYFSQYPDIDLDYEATPVAFKYLLLPHKWKWRNDITGKLHSLHGGDRNAIDERRNKIRQALKSTIENPEKDWISGLLIHAFGDSYAHTKNAYGSPEERAYGVWIGHAIPTLLGKSPDDIKRTENEPKYLAYVNDLYGTLKKDTANDAKFAAFLKFVDDLKCTGGQCPNFHALFYGDSNTEDSQIDRYRTCMNEKMRQLTVSEVQSVMDMIGGP